MTTYLRLALTGLAPVAASVLLYLLAKKTSFGALPEGTRQIICGLIFGALAVAGTEFGVPIEGAVINARDAAPLCAGLIFGAPAGVIAGVIGGVERWFAVYWGAGMYTRLACSVSTCLAGLFSAAMRRWMFDDKKPAWYYGFAAGLIMEVFHMLMIFFTNMADVKSAFGFVEICSAPMILTNAAATMLAVLAVSLLGRERLRLKREERQLTQTFARWLLLVVLVAFSVTSAFTYFLQTSFAAANSETLLKLNLEDVEAAVQDASDQNLLELTRSVAYDLNAASSIDASLLEALCRKGDSGLSEINIVGENGRITASTNPDNLDFDMASGEQSAAFLSLLRGRAELVQQYQPIAKDSAVSMKYAAVTLTRGGFVQAGYDAQRFRRDIDALVVGATHNRHVGDNGYLLIAGDDDVIVSDPHGFEGQTLASVGVPGSRDGIGDGQRFQATVFGEACYGMRASAEGYTILAFQPVSEVLFARNLSVYVTVFIEILTFAALFILVYLLIKKVVVENIHEINRSLKEITGGNLDVAVDVRTNEEFVSLSDDINSTVLTLKGYIAEAAARIDKELEVAKVIQSSTLPSVFPPWPERTDFDIFATMDTAKEVGGDFYDFYLLDGHRLAILIADVSGKGITAAMFMMKAKTILKDLAEKEPDVAQILTLANAALCEGNDAEMFVTCWMGILDLNTHILSFANAGHNPPLVRHKDGEFAYFRTRPGLVLAGMEGVKYRRGELTLAPGDAIYLYTDGVTEATDAANRLYGEERLLAAANALLDADAKRFCQEVKTDVDAFVGDAPQFDDMTMLCLRLLPSSKVELTPDPSGMAAAGEFLRRTLADHQVPPAVATKLDIALDEIFSNIIRYSGATQAALECAVAGGRVTLRFTDNGKPYDPTQAPEPDVTLSAQEREIGGLGIFMVKKSMDSVVYAFRDGQNILTLVKSF